jgi:hypothetical protein
MTPRNQFSRALAGIYAAAMITASLMSPLPCAARDGFAAADTDKDGRVSPAEFERYLVEYVFSEADANRDARVTFEEWSADNPDADARRFNGPDRNGDRVVTKEELKAFFERENTFKTIFEQIDADNDGHLSRAENKSFVSKVKANAPSSKP